MAVPRILAGRTLLDKLPYWLALPAGMAIGVYAGYQASMPEVGDKRVIGALVVVVIAVGLARFAPRPTRPGRALESETRTTIAAKRGPGDADATLSLDPDDALDDESLCD